MGWFLDTYCTDLTNLAACGMLEPMVGREKEMDRIVQVLGRRQKNNPVIVGPSGVGKTAIAEGVAQRIVSFEVPKVMMEKRIMAVDVGTVMAGTQLRGEFEERIVGIIAEVVLAGSILMIDEIHGLLSSGDEGAMDASGVLRPALSRGAFQCIGTTTTEEYKGVFEADPGLARRFQMIEISEPSQEDCLEILFGLRGRYEDYHGVYFTDEALSSAVCLAMRYVPSKYLPDKAIDLIDEAGALVSTGVSSKEMVSIREEMRKLTLSYNRTRNSVIRGRLEGQIVNLRVKYRYLSQQSSNRDLSRCVGADEIADIVSKLVGVPVARMTESDLETMAELEGVLRESVIGQDPAVKAVASAVKRSRTGLKDPGRPTASFIFSGPTGVGKTELCKVLSKCVFSADVVRFDMSEYMSPSDVSKMLGSAPGYVGYGKGGLLTEAVRTRPYSLLLFDEIEKAHVEIFDIMLQLLDDGRLTDSLGRLVDFKNTIVILTTNVGSQVVAGGSLESSGDNAYDRLKTLVMAELEKVFRPEFLNRLDDVIVFRRLDRENVRSISEIMIREFADRVSSLGMGLLLTGEFEKLLLSEGYDPVYGARPLRRAVTKLLEGELSEAIVRGDVAAGDIAIMDVNSEGKVIVSASKP
jgi:ATP-dependent Clp protease ATP-binding subunit ClpC